MKASAIETASRRQPAREIAKILDDCRDLAITRLTDAFSQILDKVGDMLMDRASRSDVRDEQQLFLDARGTLRGERPALMAEFEKQLRTLINERIAGKATVTAEFSKADTHNLTLVDTTAMDESVLNGNITRVVENACHDELLVLNRGMGHLLGKPDLSTDANPLSPSTIVDAFAHAVQSLKAEQAKIDPASSVEQKSRHEELEKQIGELESGKQPPRRAMAATDSGASAPATFVFYQGDFSSPREEVAPGFVSVFSPGAAEIHAPRDSTTGRRLTLANWITSPENPWTARVIVNRIWQQHFGKPLAAIPGDLGHQGEAPTNPALLDWLAAGPHGSSIAAVRSAHRRHGGAGAVYVVLRRPR